MNKLTFILLFLICSLLNAQNKDHWKKISDGERPVKYVMVIHGGSGTLPKENMTKDLEKEFRAILTEALRVGYKSLNDGGTSLDGVQAAIRILENSPLFNAGKGAVFSNDGKNEMDASIMDGATLNAGAISSVTNIKNPIDAARAVLELSEHVMLSGKGAEEFAEENGINLIDPEYFHTDERWKQLQIAKQKTTEKTGSLYSPSQIETVYGVTNLDFKIGTVGSVALDKMGNLAAGTSTGGMTNKEHGRVGDSPIIGAGTYCKNATAGVSCTGWGEYFMRNVAASRVSSLIEHGNKTIEEASSQVIKEIAEMGGDGGLIALNTKGEVATPFSTEGMYRGMVDTEGNITVIIYKK